MARKHFEQAADALVRAYGRIDRPVPAFFQLLAEKGYPTAEDTGETLTEKAIRKLFGGLGSGIETVMGRAEQRAFDFFDLLEAKGHMSQAALAAVPAYVANDNQDDGLRAA